MIIDPNKLRAVFLTPPEYIEAMAKQGKKITLKKVLRMAPGTHLGIWRKKNGKWYDMRLSYIHTKRFVKHQGPSGKRRNELMIAPWHVPLPEKNPSPH